MDVDASATKYSHRRRHCRELETCSRLKLVSLPAGSLSRSEVSLYRCTSRLPVRRPSEKMGQFVFTYTVEYNVQCTCGTSGPTRSGKLRDEHNAAVYPSASCRATQSMRTPISCVQTPFIFPLPTPHPRWCKTRCQSEVDVSPYYFYAAMRRYIHTCAFGMLSSESSG